jgi:hypothetical protein
VEASTRAPGAKEAGPAEELVDIETADAIKITRQLRKRITATE